MEEHESRGRQCKFPVEDAWDQECNLCTPDGNCSSDEAACRVDNDLFDDTDIML